MKERVKIGEIEPRIYKAMNAAEKQLSAFDLDPQLVEFIEGTGITTERVRILHQYAYERCP